MSEPVSGPADEAAGSKPSAPKDKNCPYCGQAFTSSSLGRHLDLYIKEKNPKPADGVHDVDAIRKLRGNITRRQPRGSLARRDQSTPATPVSTTPAATAPSSTRKSPAPDAAIKPPAIPKEGQFVVDHPQAPKYPFQASWEATGVINDIPTRNGDLTGSWDEASAAPDSATRPPVQRVPSRAAQKVQLDARQKLAEAMDTARAAELALRELLSSWRAAKQHIDMNSLPFEFDPLSLDFPALTLQCLQAPPTLFSSTPHPTSTSWSIQPPAQKQFEALQMYFLEEFRKWRVACAMATTATSEDLTYPPANTHFPRDVRDGVKKAERAASSLEKQINEHLQSTYHVWEQLPVQRRSELWGLELARSVGRRQKDLEKLKESQQTLKQENANLKIQIEHLNRLQQPREYRIVPPTTIPIEESLLSYCMDMAAKGHHQGVGFSADDRHVDLSTMVSRAIDRWKTVIVSSRGSGMGGQKPLDQTTPAATPTSAGTPQVPPRPSQPKSAPPAPPTPRPVPTTTTAPSAANDENSDQDADAEMEEDDGFTSITPAVAKPQAHHPLKLEVPRTRAPHPSAPNSMDGRYAPNGRVPLMRQNAADTGRGGGGQNNNAYGTVVPGVGGGDPMYMD
ncbi:hypothetical protein F4780DRAFT_736902 [Xylariomycetidae sp. FL0641]|nr:hypothetical protein F4780DRAFT_736902 [Xylariomycetidae sp. FL0641]